MNTDCLLGNKRGEHQAVAVGGGEGAAGGPHTQCEVGRDTLRSGGSGVEGEKPRGESQTHHDGR